MPERSTIIANSVLLALAACLFGLMVAMREVLAKRSSAQ